ncbi:MAG: AMP-binding protein [Rhizobiaceae bacterium]
MDSRSRAALPPFGTTIRDLLLDGAGTDPDHVLLIAGDRRITLAQLADHTRAVAADLAERGIRPGDAVATMLGNGPNHVAVFLGVALAGALWVPLSPEAKGPSLAHALAVARPKLAFATGEACQRLREAGLNEACILIETDGWALPDRSAPPPDIPAHKAKPDEARAILFTSGTSGPPKGVTVTERMLVASAAGTAIASDCHAGDVYLMWEPLHHIGGSQIVVMALARLVQLVVVERFSASALWPQVRANGVTKLHYLGGILEILLKAAPRPDDRHHPLRLAFGGGCRPEVWRAFEERFAVPLREVYGMTEASSFTTINMNGTVGSVGTPVPWFSVSLAGNDGRPVPEGGIGEIVVSSDHPELFTPGYLGAPEATAKLLRDGCLFTGDLGRFDAAGNLQYVGRLTDSLRRRGENVSAWEVETALGSHPDIAECAVVGIPAEIGEHEIMCFLSMRDGAAFDPAALAAWCTRQMPRHHVPRFWKQVAGFERTPSQRIRKDLLDRGRGDAIDTGDGRPL